MLVFLGGMRGGLTGEGITRDRVVCFYGRYEVTKQRTAVCRQMRIGTYCRFSVQFISPLTVLSNIAPTTTFYVRHHNRQPYI